MLLSNSENHEPLKNFRNVDCVDTIHNEVQDKRANHKTNHWCCLWFRFPTPYWQSLCNMITFHEYFWSSQFCEFHSKHSKQFSLFQVSNSKAFFLLAWETSLNK